MIYFCFLAHMLGGWIFFKSRTGNSVLIVTCNDRWLSITDLSAPKNISTLKMKYENKCRGFMVKLWPKFDVVTQVKLIVFLPRFSIFILKSANHCRNFIFVNISVGIHF